MDFSIQPSFKQATTSTKEGRAGTVDNPSHSKHMINNILKVKRYLASQFLIKFLIDTGAAILAIQDDIIPSNTQLQPYGCPEILLKQTLSTFGHYWTSGMSSEFFYEHLKSHTFVVVKNYQSLEF